MIIPVIVISVVAMIVYWMDKQKEEATIRENMRKYTAFIPRDTPGTSVLQRPIMAAAPVRARGSNSNTWRDPNFFDTTWDPAFVDAEEFITVDPDNSHWR